MRRSNSTRIQYSEDSKVPSVPPNSPPRSILDYNGTPLPDNINRKRRYTYPTFSPKPIFIKDKDRDDDM